jgi:hypothetical protein
MTRTAIAGRKVKGEKIMDESGKKKATGNLKEVFSVES